MAKATTPPRPLISGFCNRTLPRTAAYDPHQKCPGCDCRAEGCPCNPDRGDIPVKKIQADATTPVAPADDRTPLAPPPDDAVFAAGRAADQVNVSMKGYEPDDWRDAVRLLNRLRKVIDTLRAVDANLVRWLYLNGEHGQHQHIDGIAGEFYIGRGRSKEKWESEQGVRDYVDAKLMDAEGEVPDHETLVSWVLEVLPATSSTGLRKTPLRNVGLDPKRYVDDEPGTIRVDLPR